MSSVDSVPATASNLPPGAIPTKGGGYIQPWRKGQSGNPNRISGVYNETRKLCATATPDAARQLIKLMTCDDERVSYMACMAVIERGAGKVRDHSNEQDLSLDASTLGLLTPEERAVFVRIVRRLMTAQRANAPTIESRADGQAEQQTVDTPVSTAPPE